MNYEKEKGNVYHLFLNDYISVNMALLIYIFLFLILLLINKNKNGTFFDGFFFVAAPFVVIIALNNLLMYKLGFNIIDDKVIYLHVILLIIFFIGIECGRGLGRNFSIGTKKYFSTDIKEGTLVSITIICELIVLFDVILHIRIYGLAQFTSGQDGINRGFLAGHLTIVLIPLCIILLEFFLDKKKKKYFFLLIVGLMLIFSTFIKYHILSTVLAMFIYIALKKPQYAKKIGLISLSSIILLFVLNYIIGFVATGMLSEVNKNFYLIHLWKYIAGGTLNVKPAENYFHYSSHISEWMWVLEMLLAIPNMISIGLFGVPIIDYRFSEKMIYFDTGIDPSNVISIPGASYVQGGLVGAAVFTFFTGILIEFVYFRAKNNESIKRLIPTSIFLAYCMLSFFSSFFELSGPWEAILWGYVIVPFLCKPFSIGSKIY